MPFNPATTLRNFEFLDDDDFVTAPEFASLCGVDRRTVTRWIQAGKLPAEQGPEHGPGYLFQIRVGDARRLLTGMEAGHA